MDKQGILKMALDFLGVKGQADPKLLGQLAQAFDQLDNLAPPRPISRRLVRTSGHETPTLALQYGALKLEGESIVAFLEEAPEICIVAATLGQAVDRQLKVLQQMDVQQAVVFDAVASAYLEGLLDQWNKAFQSSLSGQGYYLSPRFSPGYGDFPLSTQVGLLAALEGQKRLGIHLNSHYLMVPQKSVTAIIGIHSKPFQSGYQRCDACQIRHHCQHKGGKCVYS